MWLSAVKNGAAPVAVAAASEAGGVTVFVVVVVDLSGQRERGSREVTHTS